MDAGRGASGVPRASRGLAFDANVEPEPPSGLTADPIAPTTSRKGVSGALTTVIDRIGNTDEPAVVDDTHRPHREFFPRNVAATATYDYAFSGSFFDRQGHRITHDIRVTVTSEDDGNRQPVARVIERRIEPVADGFTMSEKNWERLRLDIDPYERSPRRYYRSIASYLDGWHRAYVRVATVA